MMVKKVVRNWCKFVRTGSIHIVSFVPTLIGLFFIVGWFLIRVDLMKTAPQFLNYLALAIWGLLTGCSGLVYISRKEMPGPVGSTLKGLYPRIIGFLLLGFFWSISLGLIILALREDH